MDVPPHPTRALISLPALQHNLQLVRTLIGPEKKIMAVVKADAYGHGMPAVARAAVEAGCEYLAVARVPEGLALRQAGLETTPVLVFEVTPPDHIEPALRARLDLSVSSAEGAGAVARAAREAGLRARVHAKVDTGMGRLGLPAEQAAALIARIAALPGLELAGVYSHFATADDPDRSFARTQIDRFCRVLDGLKALRVEVPLRHMAGSAGIIAYPEAHFDMVRPGIMMYGYPPRRNMLLPRPLRPVLSLVTRVSFVKEVPAGTPVSYGRRYYTYRPTTIATLPVGYGDGYSRLLTNRGEVLIRGRRYRIAGTVCMDHCMIDAGPGSDIRAGDAAVLIGTDGPESVSAWDLAETIGTIPYEVTCLLTARIPRVVTPGEGLA